MNFIWAVSFQSWTYYLNTVIKGFLLCSKEYAWLWLKCECCSARPILMGLVCHKMMWILIVLQIPFCYIKLLISYFRHKKNQLQLLKVLWMALTPPNFMPRSKKTFSTAGCGNRTKANPGHGRRTPRIIKDMFITY